MSRHPSLPDHVLEALGGIVPSGDDELWYFPCRVTLRDGRIFDTVYIEPEMPYLELPVRREDCVGRNGCLRGGLGLKREENAGAKFAFPQGIHRQ